MSIVKSNYGTNNQALTITLASLASAAARQSTAVDNTSNLYLDVLFSLKVKSGASGTSASGFVNIYAYGSVDGGSSYPEGISGSDGSLTLVSPTNLRLIGTMNVVSNATSYQSEPMSIANAFGGVLPDHWGIVVENQSGGTFDASEGNFAKIYQGMLAQIV